MRYMCNYDRKEVVQDQFGCHGNIMTPSTDSGLGCREGSSKHDESLEQDITDDCTTPDSATGSTSSSSSHFTDDYTDPKLSPASVTSSHISSSVTVSPKSAAIRSFRDELELRCRDVETTKDAIATTSTCARMMRDLTITCQGQGQRSQRRTMMTSVPSVLQQQDVVSPQHTNNGLVIGPEASHRPAGLVDCSRPAPLATSFQQLQAPSPCPAVGQQRVVPRMGTKVDTARFVVSLPTSMSSTTSSRPSPSAMSPLSPAAVAISPHQAASAAALASTMMVSMVSPVTTPTPGVKLPSPSPLLADTPPPSCGRPLPPVPASVPAVPCSRSLDPLRLQTIPEVDSSTDGRCPSPMRQTTRSASLSPKQLMLMREYSRQQQALSEQQQQQQLSPQQLPPAPGGSGTDHSSDDNSDNKLKKELYTKYVDTMLTNEANLAHTIALQQKLFLQQVGSNAITLPAASTPTTRPSPCGQLPMPTSYSLSFADACLSPTGQGQCQEHQQGSFEDDPAGATMTTGRYVVRRRSDGSRYIARKSATAPPLARLRRKQMLEERARKLSDERRGTATTTDDDDAHSEAKVGKFWTKEERRAHLQRARQHKTRRNPSPDDQHRVQQQQVQSSGCQLSPQSPAGAFTPMQMSPSAATVPLNLTSQQQQQLSPSPLAGVQAAQQQAGQGVSGQQQRKISHLRPKALLDDFTTLQEILVHGVKDNITGRARVANTGLLSVTTV